MPELKIMNMDQRHRALTPPIAGSLLEAASVCLSRHHASPTVLTIVNDGVASAADIHWPLPDARIRDAWANAIDTTEDGACACVIAGVEELRRLSAVRRAETGTGADYFVGPTGSGLEDLEDLIRLEVSGVDRGDEGLVARRLRQKVAQARAGQSDLPAIAGVIGFESRTLILESVQDEP
jgi:hypothetical protein